MLIRDQSQCVEVQKVRSLEIAVAVVQRRSGEGPCVERPQCQAEQQRMGTEASLGEPGSGSIAKMCQ